MSIPVKRARRKHKSVKQQLIEIGISVSAILIVLIVIYLSIDSGTDRDYQTEDQMLTTSTAYKGSFQKLVSRVENGMSTGIPTVDDSGVTLGKRVDITIGSGDFTNFNQVTDIKTIAQEGINNQKWHPTWSGAYPMFYSKKFLQSSVLYAQSGICKLFDRYIFCATGEYWPYIMGRDIYSGTTLRIILDSGNYFDIITTDSKSNGDPLSLNTPDGKWSLAHKTPNPSGKTYSSTICEFTIIYFDPSIYPIKKASDPYRPDMNYEEDFGEIKTNPAYVGITNSFQKIPEFKGNIVAIQLIEDPRVEELLKLAEEEVKPYQDKFRADGEP